MIQGFSALSGRGDQNTKILFDLVLTDQVS
jgi:hypothetical protein